MTAPTAGTLLLMSEEQLRELVSDAVADGVARALALKSVPAKGRVSTPALAEALGVSRAKIHELADQRKLPVVWVGDVRRFDVDECVAALRALPAPPKRRAGPGRGKKRSAQ